MKRMNIMDCRLRAVYVLLSLSMLAASQAHAQQQPLSYVPVEVTARLADQVGKWIYEGMSTTEGKVERTSGVMECKLTAANAALLCTTTISTRGAAGPANEEVQLYGYDVDSKTLRVSWVNDFGFARTATGSFDGDTLRLKLKGTQDGKPTTGIDETTSKLGGQERRQRGYMDSGGKRIDEWDFTFRRMK